MAEVIAFDERKRRFDAALDNLQRTLDTGSGVPDETLNEFLEAAHDYRSDMQCMALLASTGNDSDRTL
ncbi:MAG TPA: hypothetical protein VNO32_38475 [Candidatus Acidoferrum sp.]|jgi:hypothetical protein|nr:hypothetical protein [Candidatus Acidoferrum sp.]